jgi:hypothetical protein
LSFQKISSKVEAKIAEIAKNRHISQDLTKEITSRVLELLEQERNQIEKEKTELKDYIDCLEVNFDYLDKINQAHQLRYQKLLKEKMKLQARIDALEGKKRKSNLSQSH